MRIKIKKVAYFSSFRINSEYEQKSVVSELTVKREYNFVV